MSHFNYSSREAVEKKLNDFFDRLDFLQGCGGQEESYKDWVKKTYFQIKLFLDLLKGEDYVFPRSDYDSSGAISGSCSYGAPKMTHEQYMYMKKKYEKQRGLKEILSNYERKSRILKRILREQSEKKAQMLRDPLMLLE